MSELLGSDISDYIVFVRQSPLSEPTNVNHDCLIGRFYRQDLNTNREPWSLGGISRGRASSSININIHVASLQSEPRYSQASIRKHLRVIVRRGADIPSSYGSGTDLQ